MTKINKNLKLLTVSLYNKKYMKKLSLLLTFINLVLIFPAYSLPEKYQANSIRFGAMFCLTGDCSEWGTNSRMGTELAAEQINNTGGILGKRLEVTYDDSHDTVPSDTVSAYQRLTTNKNINFILGPTWTIAGMSIAPQIAGNKNIVVISPSVGVKDFNESSDNIFNTWPHDEKATRELARYGFRQGWKSVAILGSKDPWVETQSNIFAEEFESFGGRISVKLEPLPSSRDLRSEALKIKASNPDAVFFSNYQVDVIARQLAEIKFNKPKIAILMEKDRVKAAAGALEDSVFALYEKPSAEFVASFSQKFGKQPGITADTAYDALMVLAQAIKTAESFDTEKVIVALKNLRNYKGTSGTFSFNEKGSVDKAPVLWRVKGLDYAKLSQ